MRKKACKDQQCRRAGLLLPFSEFPRNRQSPDRRNFYCKECCRRRVKECRARVREKKAAQPKPKVERKPAVIAKPELFAFSKVYDAIRSGARTRRKIREATELDYDSIGEALCELIWEAKAVRIINREFVLIEDIHLAA